jgi:hypothetical protein
MAGVPTRRSSPAPEAWALETYRKAAFRIVRRETKDLPDPRVLWPDVYRWPPA